MDRVGVERGGVGVRRETLAIGCALSSGIWGVQEWTVDRGQCRVEGKLS